MSNNICKYYKSGQKCTYNGKCVSQLSSDKNRCNSFIYLSMDLAEQLASKTEELQVEKQKVKELQAENEELQRQVSNLKSNECHLKNETKKYKKGIHKYKIVLRNKIDDLELSRREFLRQAGRYPNFYKDEIKKALDNFNKSIQLINNDNRYKQALEQIRQELEESNSLRKSRMRM